MGNNQQTDRFNTEDFCISHGFNGTVSFSGKNYISLDGHFGKDLYQIGYWRNNIPLAKNETVSLWLEYEKDAGTELALDVTLFAKNDICKIENEYHFSPKDTEGLVFVKSGRECVAFISLKAKGSGNIKVKTLHIRHSENGCPAPWKNRVVTKRREEIFYYLNPEDGKPPLNVFFTGYREKEDLDVYEKLEKQNSPFLMIADTRLNGGAFFLGDDEYEKSLIAIIESALKFLGFDSTQAVFSGISMGSFGAAFYGSFIKPYAIVLGKPLLNPGDVAGNEHLFRPGGFPASIDIAKKHMEEKGLENLAELNEYFWKVFDGADFSNTRFAVVYMLEDDYDKNAYSDLQKHLGNSGAAIYGKGIHGRHNDETKEVERWFFDRIDAIKESFNGKASI